MDKARLYKFFSSQANDAERSEIRRWVESSPENYETFLAERRFFDAATIIGDIMDEKKSAAAPVRRSSRILSRVAGIAACLAVGVGSVALDHSLHTTEAMAEVPYTTLTVPAGQRLKVDLGDGSSVWLNSNTTMRFPGVFACDSRHVEIDGEAYFSVAKDSARPFTVGTAYGSVEVTGTEFNVEAYKKAATFSLSLVEGGVKYEAPEGCYMLEPGENITVSGGVVTKGRLATEDLEWVHGIVSFSDMALRDIIARFEKYYGVDVDFCRADIADVRFSGKFYLEDGIEHALNTIRHDVGFSYEADKDFRLITIK